MDYSLAQLIKLSKKGKKSSYLKCQLAIVGNDATQHLKNAIAGMGMLNKLDIDIFDADYDQLDLQIFDKKSDLYKTNPEMILISMCTQKLYEEYTLMDNQREFAGKMMEKLKKYYNCIKANTNSGIIQFTFLENNDRIFGNFGLCLENSFLFQVKKLNMLMMEYAVREKDLFLVDLNDICFRLGKDNFFDEKFYCSAKMAISPTALPEVAKQVVDIIKAKKGMTKKCIVLDLDNTLWGGVIGDDGIDNIELGELGLGHAFTEFQSWLKELKKRGILLCVCSKNNEDIAKEPFEKHPDMVLRLEDIAMFVANWNDKAANIRYIQKTLNIGMDSIVFIDDNPFERNLVKELIPDITVPDMPEDPVLYCSFLKELNLFETISYSDNDISRTTQYQQEINRNFLEQSFDNFDDYLKGLEMKGTVNFFEEYYYPRIAQLTQRSNQFNLRTVRYTEAEIEQIAKNPNYIALYYTLKDKFGDYGLVSVVIMEKKDKDTLFINEWLMSCRVLKRGMEEFVVNEFVEIAKNSGYKKIIGEYIPTKKNHMVSGLYKQFGFFEIDEFHFELNVADYVSKKHFIRK